MNLEGLVNVCLDELNGCAATITSFFSCLPGNLQDSEKGDRQFSAGVT